MRGTWKLLRTWWLHLAAAAGLVGLSLGCTIGDQWLSFVGSVVGLCSGGFLLGRLRSNGQRRRAGPTLREQVNAAVATPADPVDTAELVETMLSDGRYALLMRPKILPNLTNSQRRRAENALKDDMAIVPAGEVLLGVASDDLLRNPESDDDDLPAGRLTTVDELYLDRDPVTNREFQQFVAAGGYHQMAIWDPQVWPAVPGFVDQSGTPGPRYWKNGSFDPEQEDHPVVGICWYEAAAYARWVGKRLPTDAEWEKAASWPVLLADSSPMQRRYPWGDRVEKDCANLWMAGVGGTAPVDAFAAGANTAGIRQLVGNVWEWTLDEYDPGDLTLPFPMKSIRGGAFDTYFDNQATSQSQSAESPMGRKHNIGFRCALSTCDLRPEEPADQEPACESDWQETDQPAEALTV
jgi:gamma-glutamyl hercynylcysteine S-oxide synthase